MATITTSGAEVLVKNISNVTTNLIRMTVDYAVNSIIIKARTSTTVLRYYALDEQNEYFTIPANQSLTLNITGFESSGREIGWIRTESGTDVVEIIGIY
jgi:hypothetical protein